MSSPISLNPSPHCFADPETQPPAVSATAYEPSSPLSTTDVSSSYTVSDSEGSIDWNETFGTVPNTPHRDIEAEMADCIIRHVNLARKLWNATRTGDMHDVASERMGRLDEKVAYSLRNRWFVGAKERCNKRNKVPE